MKRHILILPILLILSSCGVLQTRELHKEVMFTDYTPYIEAGFYLSPNDYPGPHTPVGELNLTIDPAVVKADQSGYSDSIYQQKDQVHVVELDPQEILEMAVSEAIKRDSNGISNLKIEVITIDYPYYKTTGLFGTAALFTPVKRYIVSGVLIRITNKE